MIDPGGTCALCPRLVAFRAEAAAGHPDWHNAPVPSFGPLDAPLLVVGLAPGLRGANRTGRPFTGDGAGELLYPTLAAFGLARGTYRAAIDDGFELTGCRVTNAARCVPPGNKLLPAELAACRPFLSAEIRAMASLRALFCLGGESHKQVLATLGLRAAAYPFAHGACHALAGGLVLVDSYHCSRLNTNTGRLTPLMFEQALGRLIEATR
jgi:uracil-DNA glycosylase family 4